MITRRRRIVLVCIAAVLCLLIIGGRAAGFVVDLLWFRSVGYTNVFWTNFWAGAVARLVLLLVFAAAAFFNLWLVTRTLGAIRIRRRFGNIEIAERLPHGYAIAAVAVVSLLSGWWLTVGLPDGLTILAALNPGRWGVQDPFFGHDLSFYVFRLPFLNLLQTLCALLVAWIFLLATGAYVATGAVQWSGRAPEISPFARRHLGALAAIFLALVAWAFWLDRYELAVSGSGVGGALGYADRHVGAPAFLLMAAVTLLAAAAVAWGAWQGELRWVAAGFAVVMVGSFGALEIAPALVQKLSVEPDEFRREEPFIRENLRFAHLGYGLDEIEKVDLPYSDSSALAPARVRGALASAPLWDPQPLLTAYQQKESLYPYYTFGHVQPDRYGGRPIDVSVRELDPARLNARTWQNLHLSYVHGLGAVASPVDTKAPDGSPRYYLRDLEPPTLDPDAPPTLALEDGRIFFGEEPGGTVDYVVVDGESPASGIGLDSFFRRLLFAWDFRSRNLLLSGSIPEGGRIVFDRQLFDRVHRVAPFLHLLPTAGAQPVIHDGHVVWIVDGFTTSSSFPLSPVGRLGTEPVRYARNSVKATVDALTGAVRLYAVDSSDPILAVYRRILPGLVRPVSEMPAALRSHLRVPPALLALQAEVLGTYHLTSPRAFYSKEDVWAIASETRRNAPEEMRPEFAMIPLPGSSEAEFLLVLPMVASGPRNLRALLIARNDPPHYGELRLYSLPSNQLVQGPQQVESSIDQDPTISEQLSLWKAGGSDVIRGHLLVVPLPGTLVYLEPIYLEAQAVAIPQLERVVLSDGRRVVMEPTLEAAVEALLARRPTAAAEPGGGATPLPVPSPGSLDRARALFERAEEQLRAGDWTGFGESWRALGQLLQGESAAPTGRS